MFEVFIDKNFISISNKRTLTEWSTLEKNYKQNNTEKKKKKFKNSYEPFQNVAVSGLFYNSNRLNNFIKIRFECKSNANLQFTQANLTKNKVNFEWIQAFCKFFSIVWGTKMKPTNSQ